VNKLLIALAALAATAPAIAADQQPHEEGIESQDYVWNEMYAEKLQALKAKGDALRGEIAFEVCQGCHRASALGRPDGSYPRLAGQHATVLIKQLTDVRAGRRDNPKMYPFADKHVIGPQDIADIALYLQDLPSPPDNGKGSGVNLDQARKMYSDKCSKCHGDNGEGDADKFYPRVTGQHYKYLLRESLAIRDGQRRNANPKMVKVIKNFSNDDLMAISDYMSRFESK
jgi:cytochrome c553